MAWQREVRSLLPTEQPTEVDTVFFAGFYDGEGSCQWQKSNGITVQVVQKDPELLYRARARWGGSIHVTKSGVSHWVTSGDRARRFLISIYPFLSTRRKKQVEEAGGLELSGKDGLQVSGIEPERAKLRAKMTDSQRHSETCVRWARNNRDKAKEISLRFGQKNREKINARQRERRALAKMKECTSPQENSGRSTLVN